MGKTFVTNALSFGMQTATIKEVTAEEGNNKNPFDDLEIEQNEKRW